MDLEMAKKNNNNQTTLFKMEEKEKEISDKIDALNIGDEDDFERQVDELNAAEPEINSYVHNDGFAEDDSPKKKNTSRTDFAEPTNFEEAFLLPEESEVKNADAQKTKGAPKKPKPEPKPAINPAFDDMSTVQKKKSTKVFAKMLVEGFCKLFERGFVWYATLDTREDKLIGYETSGEMDLSVLLTLPDDQKQTVKEWFISMNLTAEQMAVISEENKEQLATSLAALLMEKGFAPTPAQQLMIDMVVVFVIEKGAQLLEFKIQTGSVLNQLRELKASGIEAQQQEAQARRAQQAQAREVKQEVADRVDEQQAETQEEESKDDDGITDAVVEEIIDNED